MIEKIRFLSIIGDMEIDTTSLTITQALQDEETRLGLTPACYRQIERLDPIINAFITVADVIARSPAGATRQSPVDEEIASGQRTPLAHHPRRGMTLKNIPIALKDIFETAGIRTTAGSLFFKDYIPEQDAVVVEKLKAA